MTGSTVPSEAVEAAARAIGGYNAEQWQRWQHTSKGQQAHELAVDALAAAAPILQAQERERIAELESRVQQLLTAPHKLCFEDRWRAGWLAGRAHSALELAAENQRREQEG